MESAYEGNAIGFFIRYYEGADGTRKCSYGNKFCAELFPYCHRGYGDFIWWWLALR